MHVVFEYSGILPARHYGGTERVVFYLMKALRRLGHRVTLIGPPRSQVQSLGVDLISRPPENWERAIPKDADIVHLQGTPHRDLPKPFVVTIHGNGQPGERFHRNTLFISARHASRHGARAFVHNGIDFSEMPFEATTSPQWNRFLFLAKASWKVKNLRDCLYVCSKHKKDLHIAGGWSWRSLFSPTIYSHGMVDDVQKMKLLNQCDALLFPVRWEEPFGIAMLEAFSQGRPVIGSRYGSLPEIIQEDVGILCNSLDEFETAVLRPSKRFDARRIRTYGETFFSSEVMARNYLSFYERVLAGEPLQPTDPVAPATPAQDLLPF